MRCAEAPSGRASAPDISSVSREFLWSFQAGLRASLRRAAAGELQDIVNQINRLLRC
jgi:hypothetical protein